MNADQARWLTKFDQMIVSANEQYESLAYDDLATREQMIKKLKQQIADLETMAR